MGKDLLHKLEAKFRQGLINYEDTPEKLKRKWNRSNFTIGTYRKLKKDKIEKQHGISF